MTSNQQGFTLVELMISLVLGLIIVAAGTMLFLSAYKNLAIQNASSEQQNNANFALNYILKDLRIINLNTQSTTLNKSTEFGGIIFGETSTCAGDNVIDKWSCTNESKSNIENHSNDRLTIRYRPQYINSFDCAGNKIEDTTNYVVQTYFVRPVSTTDLAQDENASNTFALVCQAGRQNPITKSITWTENGSQMIMNRVDYFKVNLIIQKKTNIREIPISDYTDSTDSTDSTDNKDNTNNIIGIHVEVIARSPQKISENGLSTFHILGDTVTLKNDVSKNYIRERISTTIAIRNAFGGRK